MRKTIIFGAIAALFGLAAMAWASNDQTKGIMKDDAQIAQKAEIDGPGRKAERAEYSVRERHGEAREHSKEARDRKHESGAYEERE